MTARRMREAAAVDALEYAFQIRRLPNDLYGDPRQYAGNCLECAAERIRSLPLPSPTDADVERVADNPALWSALQDYVKAAKWGASLELRQAIARAAIQAYEGGGE